MNHTQHDLSYNKTSLDYMALIQTAESAYASLLNSINKHSSILWETSDNVKRYLEAGYLERDAKQLVIIAETLSTLKEGLTREELIIVNKPVMNPNNGE